MDEQRYQEAVQLQRQRMAQRTPEQVKEWSANRVPTQDELDSHYQQTLLNQAQPVGTRSSTEPTGFVYILTNPSIPNLIKIGYTTETPQARANSISSGTGVPTSYVVEWSIECINGAKAYDVEKAVHFALASNRVNRAREFFNCAISDAVDVITTLAHRQHAVLIPDPAVVARQQAAATERIAQLNQRKEQLRIAAEEQKNWQAEQRRLLDVRIAKEKANEQAREKESTREFNQIVNVIFFVLVAASLYAGSIPSLLILFLLAWWWSS